MKNIFSFVFALTFTLLCMTTAAGPANVIYDFESHSYSPGVVFPDLDFNGTVSGQLTTSFSELNGTFGVERLILNFEKMPKIVVQGFSREDDQTYIAHVQNAWIFRSVKVVVHSPETFEFPQVADVRIFVDYKESYVGNLQPGLEEGPILVDFPFTPVPRSNFSVIDTYRTTFNDKPVILKLNKNLTRTVDPMYGFFNEGFELKVTWFGHGEGTYYFPHPLIPGIQAFAIQSDKNFIPPASPESISVEFRDIGMTNITPPIPLEQILLEAIPSTTPAFP